LAASPSFKEGKKFHIDAEGFPGIHDIMHDKEAMEIIGEEQVVNGIANSFPKLADTRENYSRLIQETWRYNSNPDNKKYIAIVETSEEDGRLVVSVERRTRENEAIANDQYSTLVLNERLANALAPIGITIDDITEAEREAGRIGVTDFQHAKNLAEDCVSMIRLANNHEGFKAFGEEFSHLVIGTYHDEPYIQRRLNLDAVGVQAAALSAPGREQLLG